MPHFLKPLAALVIAGALLPVGARAQMMDSVRGLQIQHPGEGISPNPPIRLYCGPYKRSGPSAPVYVDGRLIDDATLAHIKPDDIATVKVVRAPDARKLSPDAARVGALIITTKAGEHTHAVRAFDRRLVKMASKQFTGPK